MRPPQGGAIRADSSVHLGELCTIQVALKGNGRCSPERRDMRGGEEAARAGLEVVVGRIKPKAAIRSDALRGADQHDGYSLETSESPRSSQ